MFDQIFILIEYKSFFHLYNRVLDVVLPLLVLVIIAEFSFGLFLFANFNIFRALLGLL